ACYGAGSGTAVTAILYDHRNCYFRIFRRRISDKQGMVTMTLLGFALVIFLTLLDTDYLGRPGLGGNGIRAAGTHSGCSPSRQSHINHALFHQFHILGVERDLISA